jgi:ferredoxin
VLAEILQQYDQRAWNEALDALAAEMHPVDREATRIWFYFFPLTLAEALAATANRAELIHRYRLAGAFSLDGQVDTSHSFLYGHRYWCAVKAHLLNSRDQAFDVHGGLPAIARGAARAAAGNVEPSRLVGITLVGLMTLRQVGVDAFRRNPVPPDRMAEPGPSPEELVAVRQKDDRQGLLGFLRGPKTEFSVRFDERRRDATFRLINQQDLTMAAATDTRDYLSGPRPSREGPIPTDCRSASCGTCWVGVLGGRSKLSEVDDLERRRLREFGYITTDEPRPIIRLACMAKASGNITITIPTWNGIIGRLA